MQAAPNPSERREAFPAELLRRIGQLDAAITALGNTIRVIGFDAVSTELVEGHGHTVDNHSPQENPRIHQQPSTAPNQPPMFATSPNGLDPLQAAREQVRRTAMPQSDYSDFGNPIL